MAPALDRGDDGSAEPHARTPAQRYAQFRDRQSHPELTSFRALYDFEFDDFQVQACTALNEGNGVLVAAPTGSGKTVVGEFAVHLALERGLKCFYTTPIKALSNQKTPTWCAGTTAGPSACSPATTASTAKRPSWS